MAAPQVARTAAEGALLDAAERLLLAEGYAAITTRRLAAEAGVNHGLVHYYFGSVENVLVRVLERFTERLIARQRSMYADPDVPFAEKWRTAMRYLDADREYQKVWYELQALAEAFAEPRQRHGITIPLDALVTLVITFNEGIILERLSGVENGQRELLDWIEGWLEEAEG
jgi:AcrR family transcriptional regulator